MHGYSSYVTDMYHRCYHEKHYTYENFMGIIRFTIKIINGKWSLFIVNSMKNEYIYW